MSYTTIVPNSDNAEKAKQVLAKKSITGLEVIIGADNQLLIDYDYEEIPEQRFQKALNFLKQRVESGVITYHTYRSKSGKHWHVIVNLPISMTETERLVWHQIFGSDSSRDALSMIAISRNVSNPILLFMFENKKSEKDVEVITTNVSRKFRIDE
jgi:hypothetical protein